MPARLLVTAALRGFTDRNAELTLEGATVGELLGSLVTRYPDIRPHIFDEAGSLRAFINVFVGDRNIKSTGGLGTPLADGDTVTLVPAIAGGAPGCL
ncbi:MAG: MoaD family protein [Deltaproteobacteria bacterium]|jgi:MoaD family protein|nr:MoaD family protein [Deltaproteobacteria bacterium]